MPKQKISTKVEGNNIIIKLPIGLMASACSEREDSNMAHKVKDKKLFAKEVAKRIEEVQTHEDGSTALTRLLDDTFDEIFEDGVDCFDQKFENEKEYPF